MEITVNLQQASEPIAVMRLQGSIDASNFVQIVDKAQEIYQNPARNLILDLSEVPSISSTGLAAIHKIALVLQRRPRPNETSRPDAQQQCTQTCQAPQPTARCR